MYTSKMWLLIVIKKNGQFCFCCEDIFHNVFSATAMFSSMPLSCSVLCSCYIVCSPVVINTIIMKPTIEEASAKK